MPTSGTLLRHGLCRALESFHVILQVQWHQFVWNDEIFQRPVSQPYPASSCTVETLPLAYCQAPREDARPDGTLVTRRPDLGDHRAVSGIELLVDPATGGSMRSIRTTLHVRRLLECNQTWQPCSDATR